MFSVCQTESRIPALPWAPDTPTPQTPLTPPRHAHAAPVSDTEVGAGLWGAQCSPWAPKCLRNVGFRSHSQIPGEDPAAPASRTEHGSLQPGASQSCQGAGAGVTLLLPRPSTGHGGAMAALAPQSSPAAPSTQLQPRSWEVCLETSPTRITGKATVVSFQEKRDLEKELKLFSFGQKYS